MIHYISSSPRFVVATLALPSAVARAPKRPIGKRPSGRCAACNGADVMNEKRPDRPARCSIPNTPDIRTPTDPYARCLLTRNNEQIDGYVCSTDAATSGPTPTTRGGGRRGNMVTAGRRDRRGRGTGRLVRAQILGLSCGLSSCSYRQIRRCKNPSKHRDSERRRMV
jgi:hypothetical protein